MTAKSTSTKKPIDGYKAAFVQRGSSINKWAKANGYNPSVVYDALSGVRRGPVSRKIVAAADKHLEETSKSAAA